MFIRIMETNGGGERVLDIEDMDLPDLGAAFNLLESLLGDVEDLIKAGPLAWRKLDDQTRQDLQDWYNSQRLDAEDKQLLADLYNAGRFEAWDCPECGNRVCAGSPESWANFQGTNNPDYTSYPGDAKKYRPAYLAKMCDYCRRMS